MFSQVSCIWILHLISGAVHAASLNFTGFSTGNHEKLSEFNHGECSDGQSIKWNEIYPEHRISDEWILATLDQEPHKGGSSSEQEVLYGIKSFPISDGRTAANYGPPRDYSLTVDTMILSQIPADKAQYLGEYLDDWIEAGFSAHFIILEHSVVRWVSPIGQKAQMAADWNRRALSVLILTDETQNVREGQIKLLKFVKGWVSPSPAFKIDIQYMLSHDEARQSGEDGRVTNIDYVRERLCLGNNPPAQCAPRSAC